MSTTTIDRETRRQVRTDDDTVVTISANGESATTTLAGMKQVARNLKIKNIAVPSPGQFEEEQFIPAPELVALAETLRERHEMPTEITLDVVWKREGGTSNGQPCWSKTVKTDRGLIGFYAPVDVTIWVAADHMDSMVEPARLPWVIEAVLYSQLCRLDVDEKLRPVIKPLDFVGMRAEIENYGLWRSELRSAAESFKQAELFA